MTTKILLAGDGGQGVQTIADIICRAAFAKGLQVTHIPNYGLEQRGGVSLSYIKIDNDKIGYPKFTQPDILVVLSPQARERSKQYFHKNVKSLDVADFKDEFSAKNTSMQNLNIFFLGLLAKVLEGKNILSVAEIYEILEQKLNKKPNWEEIKRVFN
ncbi:MAG: 2-oxoacid:acceptor oxidoreductase family protein [Candidatus Magasanikbacteria bacterium]|jgi:2-oxoglutarate ferredoxin oxidoreductase subunit gamma